MTDLPTAFEQRVLEVLEGSRGKVNAAWLASKIWPDAKGKWFGARSGRWQRMGAILNRMGSRGLVRCVTTEFNQRLWTSTRKQP